MKDNISAAAVTGALPRTRTSLLKFTKEPFAADRLDGKFALCALLLGFLFVRWVLFSWQGWGVTVFTLLYCLAVSLYLQKKGLAFSQAGWFWLAALILTGISYALWSNNSMEPWRSLLLFGSAVYWVISATGLPILGKTSNWLGLDAINGLAVIPFRNFTCHYNSLAFFSRNKKAGAEQLFSIALGLFFTLIVGLLVMPLLFRADSGGFARMTDKIWAFIGAEEVVELLVQSLLAIPVAAYLFGLVAGSAHKRGVSVFNQEAIRRAASSLCLLPEATVFTLLGMLCVLYVLFVGSQVPYFFSAFYGQRPEGWQVYSEYARSGFFELCRIVAINLFVLTGANLFSKKSEKDSLGLKALNCVLSLLTLLLIATAFSKMALYIDVYGLSVRRLLPCLFMVFLAIIWVAVAALQKWQFSIMRLAACAGTVMLCMLCLVNIDGLVARYNADRYLAGTLAGYDVSILYRGGSAGVEPVLDLYARTADPQLKAELEKYLLRQEKDLKKVSGKSRDNWQNIQARQKMQEVIRALEAGSQILD